MKDLYRWKRYTIRDSKARDSARGGYEGLPRFEKCSFKGEYPFGTAFLSDPEVPVTVSITGFNPFIPLDDKNSGIPCAILEYTLENTSSKTVDYEFSYHLSHLATGSRGDAFSFNKVLPGRGIYFYNEDHPDCEHMGSAALAVIGNDPVIKGMWFRGGWFDSISALWRESPQPVSFSPIMAPIPLTNMDEWWLDYA